jgi:intracellular sulfur oxidation DsrE/DsrF family protein
MHTRKEFLAGAAQAGVVAAAIDPSALQSAAEQPFRHRQVFAARGANADALCSEMANSLDAYEHDLGEGAGTLHLAAVLYGEGAAVALDDAAWTKYKLGERFGRNGTGNSFAAPIAALMHRKASFFVCNRALSGLAVSLFNAAPNPGKTADDVLADLQTHVLAGISIVPAGVAALNALQEAKFTYVQASL